MVSIDSGRSTGSRPATRSRPREPVSEAQLFLSSHRDTGSGSWARTGGKVSVGLRKAAGREALGAPRNPAGESNS